MKYLEEGVKRLIDITFRNSSKQFQSNISNLNFPFTIVSHLSMTIGT